VHNIVQIADHTQKLLIDTIQGVLNDYSARIAITRNNKKKNLLAREKNRLKEKFENDQQTGDFTDTLDFVINDLNARMEGWKTMIDSNQDISVNELVRIKQDVEYAKYIVDRLNTKVATIDFTDLNNVIVEIQSFYNQAIIEKIKEFYRPYAQSMMEETGMSEDDFNTLFLNITDTSSNA